MMLARYILLGAFALFSNIYLIAQVHNVDSLKNIIEKKPLDSTRLHLLSLLSNVYRVYRSEYDSALKYANQCLVLAHQLKNKKYQGAAHYELGTIYSMFGNYDESNNRLFEALKIFEQLGNEQQIGLLYQVLGLNYQSLNNSAKAREYLEKGLEKRRLVKDSMGIAQSCNSLAELIVQMGEFDKAFLLQDEALKIFNLLGTRGPAWGLPYTYQVIGNNYLMHGKATKKKLQSDTAAWRELFRQALYYSNKSLEGWTNLKVMDGEAGLHDQMSEVLMSLDRVDEARYHIDQGIKKAIASDDMVDLIQLYYHLSQADSMEGKFNDAYFNFIKHSNLSDSFYKASAGYNLMQKSFRYETEKRDAILKAEQEKKDAIAKRKRNLQNSIIAGITLFAIFLSFLVYQNRKASKKISKAYENLKATQKQLIQSEKMASLGELTAGIAHEIQNPLNFVNNFSEVNRELIDEMKAELASGNLQSVKEIAHNIRENEEKIGHHGKRADAIVKSMLQHSRNSSGIQEPTDINSLADEYLRLSYHGLRAKDSSFQAKFETRFDPAAGKINIVPQEIGRVLLNLLNNAFFAVMDRKKSGGQGYVPLVSLRTERRDNRVEISIEDNGNGIPPELLSKIFQPFFTTKPTGQGTGLGLSLSYDIIKAHNGEIEVESRKGEGSRFSILLPV